MTQKKVVENDYSMQEKIMSLYELQKIDSQIDEINKIKGELPLEVKDLEDGLEGLNTRIANIKAEVDQVDSLTNQRNREIDEARIKIANYKEQHNNVRNNREWDAINKEIEYQELEITLSEKRLKEYAVTIVEKRALYAKAEEALAEHQVELNAKRQELETIEQETADQVVALRAKGEISASRIDDRLLTAYNRIRSNVRNGLAVVTVRRDACGGCFNRIPPQRQVEIRQGKKIIVCEYCGRILVSDPAEEENM
ncbi:MAG: C4-type zinc ribbon domain-containing protein [Rikenellaceae bacterium]